MGLLERWNMKTNQFLRAAGLAAAVVALYLSGCTEKNYTVNQCPSETVHIKGTVYAWHCSIGDIWNNDPNPERNRFSLNTGEPAIVTFIRDNGFVTTIETDDSSDFVLYLSAGPHKIAVETGYTYPPDTFYNVQLRPGDTTLPLNIIYQVDDPLYITNVFWYSTINDTQSAQAEWEMLLELNRRTQVSGKSFPALDISWNASPSEYRQVDQSPYTRTVFTRYVLPVRRDYQGYLKQWNVIEACNLLLDLIGQDTTGLVYPEFGLYPTGIYGCLD
jgi:hypothetical protein